MYGKEEEQKTVAQSFQQYQGQGNKNWGFGTHKEKHAVFQSRL